MDVHRNPATRAERPEADESTGTGAGNPAESQAVDGETLRVGAYRLVRPLGRGGMGEVFLAWDERLKRNVAIKRIRVERAGDDDSRGRFRREARAVAKLSHPAIVQIFDVLESPEGDSIVMEYVEGKSLVQAIATADLDLLTVIRLAGEIADGLGEAHDKGLVHRDLKPENVMLTAGPRPRAKILDFGLARALHKEVLTNESGDFLTRSGAVIGTAYAMSPEQASGRSVDHRSDLFALGSLIYQTLSGTAPFRGESFLDTLERVKSHRPPPIRALRPEVPPTLDTLVMGLLAKDPAGRPQNAHLVETELRRIGLELETGASATPATHPAGLADLTTLAGAATATDPCSPREDTVETVVRTLVLTDLVDSTRLVESLGDLKASEVFARHDRMARDLLERHHGLEIDKSDGFLLLFERPFDAIGYTLGYHRALAELALELDVALAARAAVHLGEVVLRHNSRGDVSRGAKPLEVEGLAKPTAARLMSLAGARQTLLSRSAFDLGRRSAVDEERWDESLHWLAHGKYVAKGVDEPLEVFEVGLSGVAPLAAPADSQKARRASTLSDELVLGWRPAAGQPIPRRHHWILAERLGEGGFGEVWLAAHESGEKRVFKFCFDAARLRTLQREVTLFRLLKETLGHRDDIARILDWSFDEAPYFLESEYTEGGNLPRWAEVQGGLAEVPLATRLELVAQVADALAAAHSVGVLHKDVKPENVLITTDPAGRPRIQLIDFGVSLLTDRGVLAARGLPAVGFTEMELGDSKAGTRMYTAPELIEGKAATMQADIYPLGVLLYQIVVGDFSRGLAPGWRRDIEDEILAEDIAFFVDGAPEKRAQNAREVAEHLRSLEHRRARRRAARRRHRRRRLAAAATSAALLILAVISIFALQAVRARDRESELYQESVMRRQQAEALIEFMLGDLREKLASVGKLEILEDVGDAATKYFSTIPEERLSNEELLQRSQALSQIGDVRFQLGNLAGATEAFRESLKLTKDLTIREPENTDWQFGLCQSHFWIGHLLFRQKELDQALEHLRSYREIAENLVEQDPKNEEWQLELAFAHSNIASVLYQQKDLERAQLELEISTGILKPLVGRQPLWEPELATAYSKLGSVLRLRGDLQQALQRYEEALAIRQRLYDRNSSDPTQLRLLATIHFHIGDLWRMRGESAKALDHYRLDLDLAQKVLARDPVNIEWQRQVAVSQERVGRVYSYLGDLEMARYFINAAIGTTRKLVAADEDNSEWRLELAHQNVSLARVLLLQGNPGAAARVGLEALDSLATLAEETSEDATLQRAWSRGLWVQGRIQAALGDADAARKSWIHGTELIELHARNSSNVALLDVWVRNLAQLGQMQIMDFAVQHLEKIGYREAEYLESL